MTTILIVIATLMVLATAYVVLRLIIADMYKE